MTQDSSNLIWIDLEMTGLDVDNDQIIEIATIVTDKHLNILDRGPILAIHQPDKILNAMDDWNKTHHGHSGLIDRVKASTIAASEAEAETLRFLKPWVGAKKSPMCGNSICQDRRFLHRLMPKLEQYFHYRNLDVSTLKELALRWAPEVKNSFVKEGLHTAAGDVIESIDELKHYREHFMKLP
ncbi:MAG: oligoribonuclease [Methylococcales bacterium]|nr:oligoribonuclease [Methylococcales bacterium]MCK5924540.1 oligoribonuclease [Methylococcales bacterium]